MPIQEQNIVFVRSQVMDDVPEGGGAATGTVIPDGVMNNVFEDISDLDRAYGRFNLRKLFLAVRTLSTDLYGGAKTLITRLPTDPALGYTLFTTNDPFDTRATAAGRVEAYLYKGPGWNGALNENHITGMRAISVIQNLDTQLPPIGKTLCLVEDEGLAGQKEQYVRVIKVEAVRTEFEDDNGIYYKWIVRMDLSDALRFDFDGHTVNRTNTYNYTGKTRIRDTTVADATRYYGSRPLAVAAQIGDLSVKATSMFAQLVPSAQTETPLVSQTLNPNVTIAVNVGARGVVDIPQQSQSLAMAVTAENRRLNWPVTISPLPAAGTLTVSYMAQGNWYLLNDADGIVSGTDPAFGSGTINYATGVLSVTLGALPDVGSQIIVLWATTALYLPMGDLIQAPLNPRFFATLPRSTSDHTVVPGSVRIRDQGVEIGSDAGANGSGVLTGSGISSGWINYKTGLVELFPLTAPAPATVFQIDYDEAVVITQTFHAPNRDQSGHVVLDIGNNLIAGSVRVSWNTDLTTPASAIGLPRAIDPIHIGIDQGDGTLQLADGLAVGSINYVSGAVDFLPDSVIAYPRQNFVKVNAGTEFERLDFVSISYVNAPQIAPPDFDVTTTHLESAAGSARTAEATLAEISVDLTPYTTNVIIPNTLQFTVLGKTYIDYNGSLYSDNLLAGALDYATGRATLTYWLAGSASFVPTVSSGITSFGEPFVYRALFRTALSPVKPESVQLVGTTRDGTMFAIIADADGHFVTPPVSGSVNYEFGTANLRFGDWKLLSELTPEEMTEWWYDPVFIDGNQIFKPTPVLASTLTYTAVAYSYLPLDADILGIDAVRLPSDGRVPIYRAGDVVMILHADTTTGVPAQVGGTGPYLLSCGRTRLAFARVTDANGAAVTEGYTLDRAAGVLSWDSLAGLATPVTVTHTVGDLRLVTDAQINGQLALSRPLTHEYPADESIVAACLIHGDRRARVSAVWDQASWNSTWTDALVGSAATATLNTIDYPITVTNEGCDTDRWLLRWLTTTTVELISEKRGLVWSGSYPAYVSGTPVDIAPINPRTRDEQGLNGTPYLTIPQQANGGGWSAGNVVRINTVGAIADFWIARAIMQSDEPAGDGADGCEIYTLGNIDRP